MMPRADTGGSAVIHCALRPAKMKQKQSTWIRAVAVQLKKRAWTPIERDWETGSGKPLSD
jgi:hypothetical protein